MAFWQQYIVKTKIKHMNSNGINSSALDRNRQLGQASELCRVVHCKRQPYDVYIGRPSKWGNPFSHNEGTLAKYKVATRAAAVEAYQKWITVGDGRYLLKHLHELKGKTLGCWCKPQSCHGDILAQLTAQYCSQTTQ